MNKRYSTEQLEFIRDHYKTMPLSDVAPLFNARFNTDVSAKALHSTVKNHQIVCGRKAGERIMPCRLYTKEQTQFLRENYSGRSVAELTALFNDHFRKGMTQQQIKSFVHNRGITSGRTGHFKKGQSPWNLGTKGYMGPNKTSFKKGNNPPNRKPIGSERICSKDGFILVKVEERNPYTGSPTRYKHKHVHVWEQKHGPVPEGYVVALRDGNKLNCDDDNLMLITRAELLSLNLHNYGEIPEELKPSVLALAKLEAKAGIRTRPVRGRKTSINPEARAAR